MRKIFSSILAVALLVACFSIVSFANTTDAMYFDNGSGAITATEDTISIDVYLKATSEMEEMWISSLSGDYTVTNGSVTAFAKVSGLTNLTDNSSKAKVFYYTSGESYAPTAGESVKIANITVTREGTAANSILSLSNAVISDYDGAPYSGYTTGKITINWPSAAPEEDEIFETVNPSAASDAIAVGDVIGEGAGAITLEAGATQLAVFGKAPTGGLSKGEYGIVFNGIKFPGAVDVEAGSNWCIKLVAPAGKNLDGTVFSGTYTYQAFVGSTVSADRTAATVTAQ